MCAQFTLSCQIWTNEDIYIWYLISTLVTIIFPLEKVQIQNFQRNKKSPPPLQKGEIFLFTLFFSTFMAFLNYVLNNLNKYTIKYMLTINCTITYLRGYTMESPLYSLSYQLVLHGIQGMLQGVSPSGEKKIFFSLYQFSPIKHQNIEKILSDSEPL